MARPTQYDRDQALEASMQVFWRKGYNATSVKDLMDATGLQPGSLYGAFGNKHTLFLNTLEFYFTKQLTAVRSILHNEDAPPLERIRKFFDELLRESSGDREKKGCLLINTLLEAPLDDESGRMAARMLRSVEKSLCAVLDEAVRDGYLGPGKEAALLAKILINGIFGLRVSSKMRAGSAETRRVVDGLLSLLV